MRNEYLPIRYNALEGVQEDCEPELSPEQFYLAFEALRARGLLTVSKDLSSISTYYQISPAGQAALSALPQPPGPLSGEQMAALLAEPPLLPLESSQLPDGGYEDPSWYQVEDAYESAWEDGQKCLAGWVQDVVTRLEV